MHDVVEMLEDMCEESEARTKADKESLNLPDVLDKGKEAVLNPWMEGSPVAKALDNFFMNVQDDDTRAKLEELKREVMKLLGAHRVETAYGVYNAARLLHFLNVCEMDVRDATTEIVLNSNSRSEAEMDKKRNRIISEDLSFDTCPRALELKSYLPMNNVSLEDPFNSTRIRCDLVMEMATLACLSLTDAISRRVWLCDFTLSETQFLGRGKKGHIIQYVCYGGDADLEGAADAFTITDFVESVMYASEISTLQCDALYAIEGDVVPYVCFYDFSNGSMMKMLVSVVVVLRSSFWVGI